MIGAKWIVVSSISIALVPAGVQGNGRHAKDPGHLVAQVTSFYDGEDGSSYLDRSSNLDGSLMGLESQQVSVIASKDLQASASGYGKGYGHGKEYGDYHGNKAGYHDHDYDKGHKGYHDDHGHKGQYYSDHGKNHYKDYHDKGGKDYKGYHDKHGYYGDFDSGKKGGEGHHYGSDGHYDKGHKGKGHKDVHHHEESYSSKQYYDDHDDYSYHDKYEDYDSYFDADDAKHNEGHGKESDQYHDAEGKEGHHEEGEYHDDHEGDENYHEKEGKEQKKEGYGEKGGEKGKHGKQEHGGYGKGHDGGQKGYGSHDGGNGHSKGHTHADSYGKGDGHKGGANADYGSHSNIQTIIASAESEGKGLSKSAKTSLRSPGSQRSKSGSQRVDLKTPKSRKSYQSDISSPSKYKNKQVVNIKKLPYSKKASASRRYPIKILNRNKYPALISANEMNSAQPPSVFKIFANHQEKALINKKSPRISQEFLRPKNQRAKYSSSYRSPESISTVKDKRRVLYVDSPESSYPATRESYRDIKLAKSKASYPTKDEAVAEDYPNLTYRTLTPDKKVTETNVASSDALISRVQNSPLQGFSVYIPATSLVTNPDHYGNMTHLLIEAIQNPTLSSANQAPYIYSKGDESDLPEGYRYMKVKKYHLIPVRKGRSGKWLFSLISPTGNYKSKFGLKENMDYDAQASETSQILQRANDHDIHLPSLAMGSYRTSHSPEQESSKASYPSDLINEDDVVLSTQTNPETPSYHEEASPTSSFSDNQDQYDITLNIDPISPSETSFQEAPESVLTDIKRSLNVPEGSLDFDKFGDFSPNLKSGKIV